MKESRAIELLAPAKNLACGKAAIDHGADAVYIGADRFGARVAAGKDDGGVFESGPDIIAADVKPVSCAVFCPNVSAVIP